MRITALVENTSTRPELISEHALSLYIESNGYKILFDMGASDAFVRNAKMLGIDLNAVDFAVLSHGHYDHGGGLTAFLEVNDHAPVYMSRYAFEPHFNKQGKNIGIFSHIGIFSDAELEAKVLGQFGERLIFTEDYLRLNDAMELFSCNDRELAFPIDPFGLSCIHNEEHETLSESFSCELQTTLSEEFYLEQQERIPEDFRHEQYLLIRENNKSILISGCSHKGVKNLVSWFSPDVLVGGFHFFKIPLAASGKQRLSTAAEYLNGFPTEYITCHCTGVEQFEYLATQMPRLRYLSAGDTLKLS